MMYNLSSVIISEKFGHASVLYQNYKCFIQLGMCDRRMYTFTNGWESQRQGKTGTKEIYELVLTGTARSVQVITWVHVQYSWTLF